MVCLIGNTAKVDVDHIVHTNDIVEYGKRVTEPYKAVNRIVHPENTTVKVGNVSIGEAAQPSCAVAYSNRALRPTPFRDCKKKA